MLVQFGTLCIIIMPHSAFDHYYSGLPTKLLAEVPRCMLPCLDNQLHSIPVQCCLQLNAIG